MVPEGFRTRASFDSELGFFLKSSSLLEEFRKAGHLLHSFAGSGRPLKNVISLATLKGRTHSLVASATLAYLLDGLSKLRQ